MASIWQLVFREALLIDWMINRFGLKLNIPDVIFGCLFQLPFPALHMSARCVYNISDTGA
jgi:hypothetical protein